MKKIAALLLAAVMSSGAQADIVRLDLYGLGSYGSHEWLPFHAYVTVDKVRQAKMFADGQLEAPNMYSLGIRVGNYVCRDPMSSPKAGFGVGISPSGLGLNSMAGIGHLDPECSLNLVYETDPPLALSLNDVIPPFDELIFGSGYVNSEIFVPLSLTGYVYRVNGYVAAATDRFLIPEPSPVALIGAGLAGLMFFRRRNSARGLA